MNAFDIVGAVVFALVFIVSLVRGAEQRQRISQLERKVDALLRQQGMQQSWSPPPSDRVRDHIASGRKIAAIKEYRREHPQASLKEAKEAVEAMAVGNQTAAL